MNLQNITDYTTSLFQNNQNKDISLISNSELIRIGDLLQGIQNQNIKVPNLVVVGTQSSGKSSVLNSLIGMDILPTGKQMVTRTPLKIEIIKTNNSTNSFIEIGDYINGVWECNFTQEISYPNPSDLEKQYILDQIEKETIKKAGDQKDVSDNIIFIKIKSFNVINLSMIDLPGLTAVACTDMGQPKNIKDKIEELIKKFTSSEDSIILSIMPGRNDLEADHGLELVKKIDPNGQRTIGVLTKLDLMNDDRDIIKYLKNTVSKDLQLKYGYFAVMNRNNIEKQTINIQEGLEKEEKYFLNHSIFKQEIYRNNTGHNSLKKYLSIILAKHIKLKLPTLQIDIGNQLQTINEELKTIGIGIPDTDEGKISFIQNQIFELCNLFSFSLLKSDETARNIRDIFIKFRKEIVDNNYFKKTNILSNEDINNIIKNSEGNHMNFPFPPIEVLEICLQDKKHQPIIYMYSIIKQCNIDITNELIKLVDKLLNDSSIKRFNKLYQIIKNETNNSIILKNSKKCDKELLELLKIQESYIWTDNESFKNDLINIKDIEYDNISKSIRNLISKYIDCIIEHISDFIPKTIMYYLVHNSINKLYNHLNSVILKADLNTLLIEDLEIHERRKVLNNNQKELIRIQRELINLSII